MIAFSTPALPTQTWRPGWTLADYREVTETFFLPSFHVTPEPSANTWAEHWTNTTANCPESKSLSFLVDIYRKTLLHRAASLFSSPLCLLQLKGLYSQLSQGRSQTTNWKIWTAVCNKTISETLISACWRKGAARGELQRPKMLH